MDMIPVSSRNLEYIGYDERLMLLQIQFRNQAIYEYYDVPKNIYIGLITASSADGYFREYVKNVYRYSKV